MILVFLTALTILLLGGIASCVAGRRVLADRIGYLSAIMGSALGLLVTIWALASGQTLMLSCSWGMPYGAFILRLDCLSGVFLLPVFILSGVCALFGGEDLAELAQKRHLGVHWLFYNLLVFSMALVVTAADGLLFLICWEVMSLAPFFLVSFQDEQAQVRSASWVYLVAAHLGSLFLIVFFIKMYLLTGSLSFLDWEAIQTIPLNQAGLLFLLALLGFGAKTGIVPLHVWLPQAHPAAPSHISALMSGVLIKMGIYGLLRSLIFLSPLPEGWGVGCLLLGMATGLFGILWALPQSNLKRLLAFSSVENMGIALMGIALGIMGQQAGLPLLAGLAFAGVLLHVLNHSLCKALLFLGAGAVLHSCGTAVMELLGGALKRMPWTGFCFLAGALGIAALPPLNGFAAKFILYLAMAVPGQELDQSGVVMTWLGIMALAAMSGFALIAMVKAFSVTFLGEPRSEAALKAHDPAKAERLALLILAGGCVLAALGAPLLFKLVMTAAASLPLTSFSADLVQTIESALIWISALFVLLLLLAGLIFWARRKLLARRIIKPGITWDCGYLKPSARMQYSGSSFVQPATSELKAIIRQTETLPGLAGYFPEGKLTLEVKAPDLFSSLLYEPLFRFMAHAADRLKHLQHGKVNIYILYILVALVAALVWKLR